MVPFNSKQKDIIIQIAIAFAQVHFGIAVGSVFTLRLSIANMTMIVLNLVLTVLFVMTGLLLVRNSKHEYSTP